MVLADGGVLPFIIIPVVVVLGVIGMYFAWKAEQARLEAFRSLASDLGLQFTEARDSGHDERFARFALFRKGRSRVAYNTLHGRTEVAGHDLRVRMGDFQYKVDRGSGKNRRTETIRLSYLVAWNPLGSCPETIVRREGFFDRVAGVLGFDDIDFESVEFSKAFHVSSDDKRFAYDLIDPRMMAYLLASGPPAFELDGGLICLSTGKGRWEVPEFRQRLEWLAGFLEHWPRHLADSMSPADPGDGDRAEGGLGWFS
jgi:hypothetical protein